MSDTALHFVLRPSLFKFLCRLGVLIILGYLLLQTLALIWALGILVLLGVIGLFFRRSPRILEISHLYGDEWTIRDKDTALTLHFTHGFVWGGLAVLILSDENGQSIQSIYVMRDQLIQNKWKELKKIIKLQC